MSISLLGIPVQPPAVAFLLMATGTPFWGGLGPCSTLLRAQAVFDQAEGPRNSTTIVERKEPARHAETPVVEFRFHEPADGLRQDQRLQDDINRKFPIGRTRVLGVEVVVKVPHHATLTSLRIRLNDAALVVPRPAHAKFLERLAKAGSAFEINRIWPFPIQRSPDDWFGETRQFRLEGDVTFKGEDFVLVDGAYYLVAAIAINHVSKARIKVKARSLGRSLSWDDTYRLILDGDGRR